MSTYLFAGRIFQMVFMVIFLILALVSFRYSQKKTLEGKVPFGGIRPIVAMDHLEEAIGRSSEMGRGVHMTLGLGDFTSAWGNAGVVAGLNILGTVAEICGKLEVPLILTLCQSIVVPIARGIILDSFIQVGRPELFQDEMVRYTSEDQYAYAANAASTILSENIGTNFPIGAFSDEDLLIAESAVRAGCYQIGGNKMIFVLTCEHFMIGEELYAAGAYVSQDPALVGSIAAQDLSKTFLLIVIIAGIILSYAGLDIISKIVNM